MQRIPAEGKSNRGGPKPGRSILRRIGARYELEMSDMSGDVATPRYDHIGQGLPRRRRGARTCVSPTASSAFPGASRTVERRRQRRFL